MATFYIDPTYTGSVSDGSIDQPYKTWNEFTIAPNNSYLQKRGTETTLTASIQVFGISSSYPQITNVTLGAYGEGELPIINSKRNAEDDIIKISKADNIVVENLRLKGQIRYGTGVTTSCIAPGGWWSEGSPSTTNILIQNCVMSDAFNAVRMIPYATAASDIKILNCEVFNITDDGILSINVPNVEVGGCYVHKVNQSQINGNPNQGGDGIQFSGNVYGCHVHDCIVDRSDTANKFCIIWADTTGQQETGILIENCTLISPKPQGGGAIIYLSGGKGSIIRNCTFKYADPDGGLAGIYCHTPELKVHYNIFDKVRQGISLFDPSGFQPAEIYNNTFHMVGDGPIYSAEGVIVSTGSAYIAKNNIFSLESGVIPLHGINNTNASNNCFTEDPGVGTNNVIGDPLFVDAVNSNYNLQEGSPCRNVGASVGLEFDHAGNPIQGTPDIGALEYQDGTPTVPVAATLIQPANNSTGVDTTVLLKWTSVYNATGYKLVFNGSESDLGNVTEFEKTGLDFETTYQWYVIPYNAVGDAVNPPVWKFTTKSETVSISYIELAWNETPNTLGYKVFVGTDNPPTNIENGLDVGMIFSYRLENPQFTTTYYWKIVPYNEGGDAVDCPVWSFTTEDDGTVILPPNPTTPVYPADGATGVVIVKP